jgi:hypothetical protein
MGRGCDQVSDIIEVIIEASPAIIEVSTAPRGQKGDTGAQGPSVVIEVTAPITNTGSSTSAQLGIDQSGLTLAQSQVTNLVSDLADKLSIQAEKDYEGTPAGVIDTYPRYATQASALVSGTQYFTFFTPRTSMTVTNITVMCTSLASGVSATQLGIYSFDGSTLTLLSVVSDTATFGTVGAVTKTIASTSLSAGQRYAFSLLVSATTMPGTTRAAIEPYAAGFISPRLSAGIASASPMGSPGTTISMPLGNSSRNTTQAVWARLS